MKAFLKESEIIILADELTVVENKFTLIGRRDMSKPADGIENRFDIEDFKFEDMKDLYFPCLLIAESQHSAISVFYSEEKRIKNYILKMLENIDFKYYSNIQNLLIAFVKQSEANDVRQAILDYETKVVDGKPLFKIISSQIESNKINNWVEQFESGKLESNIINNFVILYRLLQKEFFLLNELITQVKEIEEKR